MHSATLAYLDAVARFGSIRKAADALGIASSGVNRAILKLEDEFGTPLFERTRRGVVPTAAGEHLVRHGRDTLAAYQRVQAEVASLGGNLGGEVRISAIPSLITKLLPQVIAGAASSYPLIRFSVAEANPTQITADVQAARFDIGLVLVDKPHRDIEIVHRVPAPVGAIMRAAHPLSKRKTLSLADCSGYDVVLLEDMWVLGPTLQYERSTLGNSMTARLTSNSFELNRQMILSGHGIGFFTAIAFLDEIAAGSMVHVPLSDGNLRTTTIGVTVPRSSRISPPAQAVISLIEAELAALVGNPKHEVPLKGHSHADKH